MTPIILMLEDNAERLDRLGSRWRSSASTLISWPDAQLDMIAEMGQFLRTTFLKSRDHDLEPIDRDIDPGDGLW